MHHHRTLCWIEGHGSLEYLGWLHILTTMGLFNRRKVVEADPSFITGEIDYLSEQLADEGVQLQLMAMATFLAVLFALRMTSKHLVTGLGGEHVLSIHGELNCVETRSPLRWRLESRSTYHLQSSWMQASIMSISLKKSFFHT